MVRLSDVAVIAVLCLVPASLACAAVPRVQEGATPPEVSGDVAASRAAEGEPASDEAKGRAEEKTRRRRASEGPEATLFDVGLSRMGFRAGGLVYAPPSTEHGNGFGAEFYWGRQDGRLSGAALWFAGSLAPLPDVDARIPHDDFTRRDYDSRWGLLYLFGRDNGRAALIGGLGVAIVKVDYIDTSAITGWTWDGGTKATFGLQGQLGALVHAGENAAVRFGYDSQFGGFVGLSFRF